ncbi:hypothetical protein ACFQ7F_00565 [Streptomyces sp. NPDC056486]|uniref:hypothetical protein n=1 Tax=Streptomyces sp. NPDC056486 TaxID=3345835 RepID=UPI00369FD192
MNRKRCRPHRSWPLALVASAALLAGGCGNGGSAEPTGAPARSDTAPAQNKSSPEEGQEDTGTAGGDVGGDPDGGSEETESFEPAESAEIPADGGQTPDRGWEAEAEDAVSVVDSFWSEHWNAHFTGTYASPTVFGTYTPGTAESPSCGGQPAVADNAFYCTVDDFIAWDAALMSRGYEKGDAWIYLVIAHEWAHAVQNRVDGLASEAAELQADCLAGATLFGSDDLQFEDGDSDELGQALTELADDTPWTDSQDHGDANQRINAFSAGGNDGVAACL